MNTPPEISIEQGNANPIDGPVTEERQTWAHQRARGILWALDERKLFGDDLEVLSPFQRYDLVNEIADIISQFDLERYTKLIERNAEMGERLRYIAETSEEAHIVRKAFEVL